MEKEKEVKVNDFYLTIFELLKQGLNPSKISKQLNISKQRINFYIRRFKRDKLIKKVGYGTWEVQTSKNPAPAHLKLEVRGHNYAFRIPLKELRNWDKRKEILEKRKIPFIELKNKVLRIIYKKHKVWLSDKAIIIFFPENKSYYAETSEKAEDQAVYEFKLLTNGLFRLIGIGLDKFEYNIIKNHYSLTENELAKDYYQKKKKLDLISKGHKWGLIDNSHNLHEFETISKTAKSDDKIVQTFFNDLKNNDPPTNSQLATHIDRVVSVQEMFDKNLVSHIEAIKTLSKTIDELRETVKSLKKDDLL
jgi:hypothetical protein